LSNLGEVVLVSKLRSKRIADRIRQELSVLLINDISDPRLDRVFITDVTVDRELAFADVYISALEGSKRSSEVLNGMDHARGFIRRELSQRMDLRTFPRLRFYWDPTPERADHIDKLLASIHGVDADQNQADLNKGDHES
jgi:ribosome-binding factor A